MYWHSISSGKIPLIDKTIQANLKGIDLIHILENEWVLNKKIVQAYLMEKLNLIQNDAKVDFSELKFNSISTDVYKAFLLNNCLVYDNGNMQMQYLGVFYKEELIAVCEYIICNFTLTIHNFVKSINRKVQMNIKDALLYLESTYSDIRTILIYSDGRYNLYNQEYFSNGFQIKLRSNAFPWYWKQNAKSDEKYKLLSKDKFDALDDKTGYTCIFDCGKIVYEKRIR